MERSLSTDVSHPHPAGKYDLSDYELILHLLHELDRKVEQLDQAVRGSPHNGNPGIKVRLDRLEAAEGRRSRLLWLIAAATVTLAASGTWNLFFGG